MGRRSRHQGLAGSAVRVLAIAALMVAATVVTYVLSGGQWPLGGETVAVPGTRPTAPAVTDDFEDDLPDPTATPKPSATPSAEPADEETGEAAPAPTISAADLTAVVTLVNAERKKAGCRAVTAQSQLRKAAQRHSEWQGEHGLNHVGARGSQPGDRATAAGYQWTRIGENVAHGYRTPEAVVEAWMLSAPHKANIVNCSYRHLGVGAATGSQGLFWTQLFGA